MWALTLYRSTIGKKIIMAVTGLVLVVFVIGHMAGNLQEFLGPARMNAYSAFLKSTGELLWIARLGLLAATATCSVVSQPRYRLASIPGTRCPRP